MNRSVFLRVLSLMVAAAAAFVMLCGCSKDEPPESQGEIITEMQDVPDIFIDDGAGLSNQETPPALVLEIAKGETVSATNATLGGYVWRWMDDSGRERLAEKEAPCAADMKDITTIKRSSTEGSIKMQITGGTLHLVKIWEDGAAMEESERVTVEGNTIVFPGSGAYRYEIVVDYESGRVYYAFMITE